MKRSHLLLAAAATAALAAPTAASADSIVYLDQAAVWSAAPDGSHKVQLTGTGLYHSVAQADDGTIAAATSGGIDVLARDGRPLRSIATVPAKTGNGGMHRGTPTNLAFSPDGRTIAYEYRDLSCPPASSCMIKSSTFYTSSDGPAASPHAVYGQQYNRQDPSFATNTRALIFGGAGHGVNLDDLGGGDDSHALWFTRDVDFSDGELSRDGRRLAVNVGYGDGLQLGFMITRGDTLTGSPQNPQSGDFVCETSPDKQLHGATWSPDGNAAAYGSSSGVEVVRFSSFAPGDCGVAGSSVLAPTGKSPDWGPADPPAAVYNAAPAAPAPAPAPPKAPAAAPAQRPAAAGSGSGAAGVRIATASATRAALRRGLSVRVTVPVSGRVAVRLTNGARTVASGSARARRKGEVTVRLSKVGRRAAAKLKGKRLTLAVTTAGGRTTRTLAVK